MTDKNPPLKKLRIEVYKLTNYLKQKLSPSGGKNTQEGEISPDKVSECDALIQSMCFDYLKVADNHISKISELWKKMRDMPQSDERHKISDQIFVEAHEIKDIASLCGYTLCAHFAESLRDYIAEVSLNLSGQRVIIQAHIDALNIVHKQKLKEDGGAAAEELKRMVKIAIEKYR